MARFVDGNGGEWVLRLKMSHRKPLAELGVDVRGNFGAAMSAVIAAEGDPELLAKVFDVVAVDRPAGATADTLLDSFDGETFAAARTALNEEVIDFFHHGQPATRQAARLAIGLDQMTAEALTRSFSGGSSAESPASTPPT